MTKKFFVGVVVILAVYSLAAWGIGKVVPFNGEQFNGILISGILGTLNIVIAYFIIKIAMGKDQKTFSQIFLGGLVIRLLALFIIIWIIFNYTSTDRFIFIGSLFILYFMYQVWEVLILYSNYK